MPGDYSRNTFNRKKHRSGVRMQQGRVLLDADFNEQVSIQQYRTHTEARDVIGACGVPKKNDGFKIGIAAGGHDLTISKGRIYVGGLLCELEDQATYTAQPHYPKPEHVVTSSPPAPAQISLANGTYLVFIEAWQREITANDDPLIREVALGGPDTAIRIENVWQVRLLPASQSSPPQSPPGQVSCKTPIAEFDNFFETSTGLMNARTNPQVNPKDICLLPPTAGYQGLENQLYRVEVHTGGALSAATIKWARDSAPFESLIEKFDGQVITVADMGKDEVHSFAAGDWVEVVDDQSDLNRSPRPLVEIDFITPETREVTMKSSVAQYAGLKGAKLRRWDQSGGNAGADGLQADAAQWIDLEGSIQVSFSAGDYRAGDYWLIPARTATREIEWPPYEIPNVNPIAQPPVGVKLYFCRLALIQVASGVISLLEDCRKKFPSLTEICAEDICYDNANCDLTDAKNVQEALDDLCAARDLRWHNKFLHGWGIVCGLKVICGPDAIGQQRRHVTVKSGYALDCNGNDIILEHERSIDLIDLITKTPVFANERTAAGTVQIKDGDYCLVIESGGRQGPRFRVEAKKPESAFNSIFDGTLLMDAYEDCIKKVIDVIREDLTPGPGEANVLVGPNQKRFIALMNLLIQMINKTNGSYVYLSGNDAQSNKNFEDTILREFYFKLRGLLQSHTFCAMFENVRQFPEYPYTGLDIHTIFGKGFQSRLRVAPNGRVAYTVGAGNKINVYNLQTNEMEAELEFPGGTSAIVQDVAFSSNSQQLYAVATLNNKDSMFAVADVSGFVHTWRKPVVICDVLLVTLATSPAASNNVYAIGKGKGLYEINPANINATPSPKYSFRAVGHMVISNPAGVAFATVSDAGGAPGIYNSVIRLNLKALDIHPPLFTVGKIGTGGEVTFLKGQDDIALSASGVGSPRLFVVNEVNEEKEVAIFNAFDKASNLILPIANVPLGEQTTIRLAHNPSTDCMMVTYEDSYRIGLIDPNNRLARTFRHPVQISPRSIAVSTEPRRVIVLNFASNTLTSIPADRLQPSRQIPLQKLIDYRAAVLNAYFDLLGGLLQYLKDCFCEHLLIDCPTCDEDDKIYLACINVRGGQVFNICNFSLRKYVKSFRTMEYWLSVIPIIPMIKLLIEKICCSTLTSFFGRQTAPHHTVPTDNVLVETNTFRSSQIFESVNFAQQMDFRHAITDKIANLVPGRTILADAIAHIAKQAFIPPQGPIAQTDLVGINTDEAKEKLEEANITVNKVEAYNPTEGASHLRRFAGAPSRLPAGSRVTLYEENGVVRYYSIAKESETPAVAEEISALKKDLDESRAAADDARGLREQVTALQDELASRDEEIEKLKEATASFKTHIQRLDDLQKQIDAMSKRRATRKKQEQPEKKA